MMVAPMALRILLLEDVPADAALVERHLTKSGLEFVSQRVDTRARFEQALREFVPDIILSDHGLSGFDGSAALELVNERFPTLPVILVTGSLNEEKAVEFMKAGAADDIPALHRHLETMPGDYHNAGTWRHRKKDGTLIEVETSGHGITFAGRRAEQVVINDVTERKRLEEQFRQAQKMEAVGRLAAGVAHDFNNLLTAILGTTDLMLEDLPPGDQDREGLLDIRSASERAAVLTRQLLTFSRQQVVSPQVLRLNDLILELEKLLRRLLGEDVAIRVAVAPDCGGVKADPGQLEQVIVNLAVNARDAMPNGGRLTLETKNVDLDADYPTDRVTIPAGRYVMLAVTDTGTGMDAQTKARIFEPFFTTKPVGKGTGLGLATVYGAVKQSGGYIWLYSEVGQGTSFKIYLQRIDAVEPQAAAVETAVMLDGTETVLVAEDEDAVRQIIEKALQARGYQVMVARDGSEALALASRHAGQIDLLVTDVIMPDMNGQVLSQRLTQVRPTIKTLYLSGYTDDAILHHGVLEEGVAFLQKPFSLGALARKVREVIEARP